MKDETGDKETLQWVQRTARRRLLFTGLILVLYFSFVLNWTSAGAGLTASLPGLSMTGSLLMFVLLLVGFILLEVIFLLLSRDRRKPGE